MPNDRRLLSTPVASEVAMIGRHALAVLSLSVALSTGLSPLAGPPVALAQPIPLWPPPAVGTIAIAASTTSSDDSGREVDIPSGPTVTKALLPGHWSLRGARWVWVKPDTVLRPVQTATFVPGRYVWRRGSYVWVPAHYPKPEEAN